MPCDPALHHRRSIRLRGYDYTQHGAYFVTLCIQGRRPLLGQIIEGAIVPTAAGKMVHTDWQELATHYPGVDLDLSVLMSNHVHGIILLAGGADASPPSDDPDREELTLGEVVKRFKMLTTRQYAAGVRAEGWPPFEGRLWQRNYYEHIIRDERDLDAIRVYIQNNPIQWAVDRENPDR